MGYICPEHRRRFMSAEHGGCAPLHAAAAAEACQSEDVRAARKRRDLYRAIAVAADYAANSEAVAAKWHDTDGSLARSAEANARVRRAEIQRLIERLDSCS